MHNARRILRGWIRAAIAEVQAKMKFAPTAAETGMKMEAMHPVPAPEATEVHLITTNRSEAAAKELQ